LFIALFSFAFIVFFLDKTGILLGVRGIIEGILAPSQRAIQSALTNNSQESLTQEQLLELEKLKKENEDLRMQLGSKPTSQQLLPAHVLSSVRFFVVDRGSEDGVQVGNTVVFKNIYIGKIASMTERTARVLLPTDHESVFEAKTITGAALGLIKGQGDRAIFGEVTLSEDLKEDDGIVTVGNVNEAGLGIRGGLLVGKISQVRKSDDQLFQEALLVPLVEYKNLENVFIIH